MTADITPGPRQLPEGLAGFKVMLDTVYSDQEYSHQSNITNIYRILADDIKRHNFRRIVTDNFINKPNEFKYIEMLIRSKILIPMMGNGEEVSKETVDALLLAIRNKGRYNGKLKQFTAAYLCLRWVTGAEDYIAERIASKSKQTPQELSEVKTESTQKGTNMHKVITLGENIGIATNQERIIYFTNMAYCFVTKNGVSQFCLSVLNHMRIAPANSFFMSVNAFIDSKQIFLEETNEYRRIVLAEMLRSGVATLKYMQNRLANKDTIATMVQRLNSMEEMRPCENIYVILTDAFVELLDQIDPVSPVVQRHWSLMNDSTLSDGLGGTVTVVGPILTDDSIVLDQTPIDAMVSMFKHTSPMPKTMGAKIIETVMVGLSSNDRIYSVGELRYGFHDELGAPCREIEVFDGIMYLLKTGLVKLSDSVGEDLNATNTQAYMKEMGAGAVRKLDSYWNDCFVFPVRELVVAFKETSLLEKYDKIVANRSAVVAVSRGATEDASESEPPKVRVEEYIRRFSEDDTSDVTSNYLIAMLVQADMFKRPSPTMAKVLRSGSNVRGLPAAEVALGNLIAAKVFVVHRNQGNMVEMNEKIALVNQLRKSVMSSAVDDSGFYDFLGEAMTIHLSDKARELLVLPRQIPAAGENSVPAIGKKVSITVLGQSVTVAQAMKFSALLEVAHHLAEANKDPLMAQLLKSAGIVVPFPEAIEHLGDKLADAGLQHSVSPMK